jgi:hypothetical protein
MRAGPIAVGSSQVDDQTMSVRHSGAVAFTVALLLATGCSSHPIPSDADKQLLRRFRSDPVAAYRPPDTALLSSRAVLGGTRSAPFLPGEPEVTSSELSQTMTLGGDAGDTVESYLKPATEAGWRLVTVSCFRQTLTVQAVFTTEPDGPLPGAPPGARNDRAGRVSELLSVIATAEDHLLEVRFFRGPLPEHPGPSSAGLPRRDMHCLKGFDPADPSRRASAAPARTGEQLCALVLTDPLGDELDKAPYAGAGPRSRSAECWLGIAGVEIGVVDAARSSRASFEDRRLSPYAEEGFFLVAGAAGLSDDVSGAWVDTPGGPIEVKMSQAGDEAVANIARALKKIASAPHTAPTPATTPLVTTFGAGRPNGSCPQAPLPVPECDVVRP